MCRFKRSRCERSTDVPPGQEPLVWRLLTNHALEHLADVMQVVQWYIYRWRCEDTFSALKTRGFDLQASRLNQGLALMKLGVMALWSAVRTVAMVKKRDDILTPARSFFSATELACLTRVLPQLEGSTQKQQNPYSRPCVAWAVWCVARLGAWHGTGRPGLQIIRRGLQRLDAIVLGWSLTRHDE